MKIIIELLVKGGLAPGANFFYAEDEKNKILVIMFCNEDNPAFDDLKKNLLRLISNTDSDN